MNNQTLTLPEKLALASQQHPAVAAKIEAVEAALIQKYGLPIEHVNHAEAAAMAACPAWPGGFDRHQIFYEEDCPVAGVLWSRAYGLMQIKIIGEIIQAHGWLPMFTDLPEDKIQRLHRQFGFHKFARRQDQQSLPFDDMVKVQFDLIHNMADGLDRRIMQMKNDIRLIREIPEIIQLGSPYCNDADRLALCHLSMAINCLAPAKIGRRWLAVCRAHAIIRDRLLGTQLQAAVAGVPADGLAQKIADYCQRSLETAAPGDELKIMRQVARLAELEAFQHPAIYPVTLYGPANISVTNN